MKCILGSPLLESKFNFSLCKHLLCLWERNLILELFIIGRNFKVLKLLWKQMQYSLITSWNIWTRSGWTSISSFTIIQKLFNFLIYFSILKARIRQGIPSYEVTWFKTGMKRAVLWFKIEVIANWLVLYECLLVSDHDNFMLVFHCSIEPSAILICTSLRYLLVTWKIQIIFANKLFLELVLV